MKILIAIILFALAGLGFAFYQTDNSETENIMTTETTTPEAQDDDHDHRDDEVNKDPAWVTIAPDVSMLPVSHASAVIAWSGRIIYVDPVGDPKQYTKFSEADIVFVSHRHGDHFDAENLPDMLGDETTLITTQDVADQLPANLKGEVMVVAPGDTTTFDPLTLEMIPAYNTRPEAQEYHPKSRGDIGVVFDDGSSRIYFSGDTEGTPEMRALTDIDVAFVSMNLPYTMDVDAAAEAVLAFTPRKVYPYHFRTPDGFSDVERFGELVKAANKDIEVVILDWYQEREN